MDISDKVGPLYPKKNVTIPMYSYDKPSGIVWGAIADALLAKGWSGDQIKAWLQSKSTRHLFDGAFGDSLIRFATEYVNRHEDQFKSSESEERSVVQPDVTEKKFEITFTNERDNTVVMSGEHRIIAGTEGAVVCIGYPGRLMTDEFRLTNREVLELHAILGDLLKS